MWGVKVLDECGLGSRIFVTWGFRQLQLMLQSEGLDAVYIAQLAHLVKLVVNIQLHRAHPCALPHLRQASGSTSVIRGSWVVVLGL